MRTKHALTMSVTLQFCCCVTYAIMYAWRHMRPTCRRSGGCVFWYGQDSSLLSAFLFPCARQCLLRARRRRHEISSLLVTRHRGILQLLVDDPSSLLASRLSARPLTVVAAQKICWKWRSIHSRKCSICSSVRLIHCGRDRIAHQGLIRGHWHRGDLPLAVL
jgi:hypothetical protein